MNRMLPLAALLLPLPALAQDADHTGHAGHAMPGMEMPAPEPPSDPHAGHAMDQKMDPAAPTPEPASDPHAGHAMEHRIDPAITAPESDHVAQKPPPHAALSGPEYAADRIFPGPEMAAARAATRKEMGGAGSYTAMLDRLELHSGKGADSWAWDAQGWLGGDLDKLWLKSEGEGEVRGGIEDAEVQALWSHAIGPWFDLQTGVRQDFTAGAPDRTHWVIGVQGLVPYFIEVDAAAFVSTRGDVTAQVEAEYDQRLSERLILQPRLEATLAAQDIPELGVGKGLGSLNAGIRLRYEIVREFAPYIGVEWHKEFGRTADFTRADQGDPSRVVAVVGIRAWF